MAESASPYSQTEASPLTGPSSLGSAVDPQGLTTVHEVPHHSVKYHGNGSVDNRLVSQIQAPAVSREASFVSSTGQSYNGKPLDEPPQRLRHTGPTQAAQQAWQRSTASSGPQRNANGYYRNNMTANFSNPASPKKEKRGGFRNTIRRMFGRRTTRDRTSVPDTAVYPRHVCPTPNHQSLPKTLTPKQDPQEFITSATDVKAKRAASLPASGTLRTSGLSSHPPSQPAPIPAPATKFPPPLQPGRRPPERPARPRRASVPSLVLNKQEMKAVDAAMTGPGLQDDQEPRVDAQTIGFAVTNGSNPRRRSRSVGAYRDAEHRMSPIQWRRWRRRSDEIRYWRASPDLTSLGISGFDSPQIVQKDDNDMVDEGEGEGDIGEHNGDFNFGLPADTMQNQERIGLEERLVTMEIKLMDFEYAISKLQAGSTSPSRRHSHHIRMEDRQDSVDSYLPSDQQNTEPSPVVAQETPPIVTSEWVKDINPNPRPTSVATTLKADHSGQPGVPQKGPIDRSSRSSLTGLTIDHYTTLITLVRNEQASRQRLEQQVSVLQGRLDALAPPYSSHSHAHSISQQSHSRSLSSSRRRQGFVDLRGSAKIRPHRPRSSSYSTNETDTDDDAFHDVYVTPDVTPVERERGEYERGAFDRIAGVEEGMAF